MVIKNKEEIAKSELRRQALDMIEAGIERVLPSRLVKEAVSYDGERKMLKVQDKTYDLSRGRVFVVGGGKASGQMAEALEEILGPTNITDGVVNCLDDDYHPHKIKIREAGHPLPDQRGVEGVEEMLALRAQYGIDAKDLVLCLISGGGSALMPCPAGGVSLEDQQEMTELLLASGAAIQEVNVVRKHLSKTKGGQLGRFFAPARVLSLVISDVVGDDLATIASGPTFPDGSTFQDALGVLERYDLLSKAPANVVHLLEEGLAGRIGETPKTLALCQNHLIGNNKMALEAMAEEARVLALKPYIVTSEQTGEPAEVAELRAREIIEGKYQEYDTVLIGGETTPKLPPKPGLGGRNQHYVAASMLAMEGYEADWVLASVNTDGSDFLAETAGAIGDNASLAWAAEQGLDVGAYLEGYDSHTLFKKMGSSLIITGPTGTNVGDVMVYVLK